MTAEVGRRSRRAEGRAESSAVAESVSDVLISGGGVAAAEPNIPVSLFSRDTMRHMRKNLFKLNLMKFKNELKKQRHASAASPQLKKAGHSQQRTKSTEVADVN